MSDPKRSNVIGYAHATLVYTPALLADERSIKLIGAEVRDYLRAGKSVFVKSSDAPDVVEQQLRRDEMLSGESFRLRKADGTSERIDPQRVRIAPAASNAPPQPSQYVPAPIREWIVDYSNMLEREISVAYSKGSLSLDADTADRKSRLIVVDQWLRATAKTEKKEC